MNPSTPILSASHEGKAMSNTNVTITYTTRRGADVVIRMTREAAFDRLEFLNAAELETQCYAPTDSGDTRFNYIREAGAIRAALATETA